MSEKTTIYHKLSKVLAETGRIPKRGYNAFHKYYYVLEADAFEVLRPLFAKHGLAIVFGSDLIEDGPQNKVRVRCTITIGDGDGNTIRTTVWAEAQDKSDKAVAKAYTGAMKIWCYKSFMISTGDDPERNAGESDLLPREKVTEKVTVGNV